MINLQDIQAAQTRIHNYIRHTPLVEAKPVKQPVCGAVGLGGLDGEHLREARVDRGGSLGIGGDDRGVRRGVRVEHGRAGLAFVQFGDDAGGSPGKRNGA